MNETAASHTTLRGPWLSAARLVWLTLVALMVGLFVAAAPAFYDELRTVRPAEVVAAQSNNLLYGPYLAPADVSALEQLGLSRDFYAGFTVAREIVLLLVALVITGVMVWRKADDWLALLAALAFVAALSGSVPEQLAASRPEWAATMRAVWGLGEVALIAFFYLFPDGRLVPRWIWAPPLAAFLMALAWVLVYGMDVSVMPFWLWVVLFAGFMGAGLYSQIYRYRRVSTPVQCQQTKWVVAGLAVILVAGLGYAAGYFFLLPQPGLARLLFNWVGDSILGLVRLFLPLSVAVAILRYRLWDIDLLINRTLVYGGLTVLVAGGYVLLVGGLGALLQARGNLLLSLLAAGLVAVLFQPLRLGLQRGVNRLMYGERDDPQTVLTRLGVRLEVALAPEAVLVAIAETVAQALKLPYAAITLRRGEEYEIAAEYSPLSPSSPGAWEGEVMPLAYQSESVGQLILAPRAPGEPFSPADRRLLADVARQAGPVAYAVRLAGDLQRSRELLVLAREEERRRLRRDLHDGLGPTMASLTLSLDAARNLMAREPEAAGDLLMQLKEQVQVALADIRRIAYDLRPPALDELGLVSALRERLTSYDGSGGLRLTFEAPDPLPPLPAAVEVAAYRITLEALTNVVRHAGARRCAVRLSVGAASCCWRSRTTAGGCPTRSRLASGWPPCVSAPPSWGARGCASACRWGGKQETERVMSEPIRILVADDHTLFRQGVRALLGSVDGVQVVGEAATGQEVIEQAAALQPDVVLMDLQMPGVNGIEATRRILRTSPHIGVVVVTMFEDDDSVFAAMRAGARGYILKGADQAEMLRAIRAVASGEALFGPAIAARVMHFFASPQPAVPEVFPELTDRERQVLDLIAQGCNNAKIAEQLVISPKTVRNHVSNVFSKLQVADRAQAIVRARQAGLGEN